MICKKLFRCGWTSGKRRYLCQPSNYSVRLLLRHAVRNKWRKDDKDPHCALLFRSPLLFSSHFFQLHVTFTYGTIHMELYVTYMHIPRVVPIMFLLLIVVSGFFFTFSELCFCMMRVWRRSGFVVVVASIIIDSRRSDRRLVSGRLSKTKRALTGRLREPSKSGECFPESEKGLRSPPLSARGCALNTPFASHQAISSRQKFVKPMI